MKTKSIFRLAFLLIVTVFFIAAGTSQAAPEKPTPGKGVSGEGTEPIKIGFTLDFSAKAARDPLRSKGFPIIVPTKEPNEVMQEKHWNIRNDFLKVDDPGGSKFIIPAAIPKMSETPPRIKSTKCGIGQDNEKIYRKYGLTE